MEQRKKITIRVTPEDLEALQTRAGATGLSLTALIDHLWRAGAGQVPAHAGSGSTAASTCQQEQCQQVLAELENRMAQRIDGMSAQIAQTLIQARSRQQAGN